MPATTPHPPDFCIFVEMQFCYVALAGLKLLVSSDPPTSASQTGTTGTRYHARLRAINFYQVKFISVITEKLL
ncbi:Protein GVQW1, partial [Plecturocebus cupreus]